MLYHFNLLKNRSDGKNIFSFHVGSGCADIHAFTRAISDSKWVFEVARSYGYSMKLLDIGGGYPGDDLAPVKFVDVRPICFSFK